MADIYHAMHIRVDHGRPCMVSFSFFRANPTALNMVIYHLAPWRVNALNVVSNHIENDGIVGLSRVVQLDLGVVVHFFLSQNVIVLTMNLPICTVQMKPR